MNKKRFTREEFREVWALVTQRPNISIRRLATAIQKPPSTVCSILQTMEEIGTISHEPKRHVRIVNVPLDTQYQ